MATRRGFGRRNTKRPTAVQTQKYDLKALHEDREYGVYWYSWLWHLIRPIMVFLCSALIVVGIVTIGYNKIYEDYLMPMDPGSTQSVSFEITSGQSITNIAEKLVESRLLRNASVFKYMVQFQGLASAISYGTYQLSPSMDATQLIAELSSGSQTNERTITIIPGWTAEDIADYLLDQGAITDRAGFLILLNDTERFSASSYALNLARQDGSLAGRKYAMEGYLAPDTYQVFLSASPTDIILKLLAQNNDVVDNVFYSDATDYYADEEGNFHEVERYQTTLTIDQTMILASIVEKEAANTADFARVAAVLINRLNAGWRLESDPTATYLSGAETLLVSQEDLQAVNNYNTYQKDGLPAGPICSPSEAAIRASLYPDLEYINGGYMYYCAAEPTSGELVFAKTREEHEANVARYYDSWVAYEKQRAGQ